MLAKRTIPKASMCDIYREFKGTTTTNIANYFRIKFRYIQPHNKHKKTFPRSLNKNYRVSSNKSFNKHYKLMDSLFNSSIKLIV
jgi:hypothetical protein